MRLPGALPPAVSDHCADWRHARGDSPGCRCAARISQSARRHPDAAVQPHIFGVEIGILGHEDRQPRIFLRLAEALGEGDLSAERVLEEIAIPLSRPLSMWVLPVRTLSNSIATCPEAMSVMDCCVPL